MLNRQKTVLALLRQSGGRASQLQLTKWCFLLSQEAPLRGSACYYEFVPYHYGPYSFGLKHEISSLARDGFLRENNDHWELTQTGLTHSLKMSPAQKDDIKYINALYQALTVSELLKSVYSRYEWFTINAKDERKRALLRPVSPTRTYTAGYEQLQVDGFLNLLLQKGVQRVIDVRSNPVARRYGFHKSTLQKLCANLSIEYVHTPEVGIPSNWRANLKTFADYEELFARYEADVLPEQSETIQKISQWQAEKPSVLICQEANPLYCHRARLAKSVSLLSNLPVEHLGWPR